MIDTGAQWMHLRVLMKDKGFSFGMTVVYGFNTAVERLPLWAAIKRLAITMTEPWVIGGDFNSMLTLSDKQGGQMVLPSDIQDFKECVTHCQLQDMLSKGAFFTWNNRQEKERRVYSKIDRTLVNEAWMKELPAVVTWFREELFSDHTPMIFSLSSDMRPRVSTFKYCNMWA